MGMSTIARMLSVVVIVGNAALPAALAQIPKPTDAPRPMTPEQSAAVVSIA